MINSIIFPKNNNTKYYNTHYKFIIDLAKFEKIPITYCESTTLDEPRFTIKVNDKLIVIDFYDFHRLYEGYKKYKYYFKYQYQEIKNEKISNIFPMGTMSFWDWKRYFKLKKEINYKCNNDIILNNQKVINQSRERRGKVREILIKKYSNLVDYCFTDKGIYWKKINNCLVGVFAPGATNNMLDKGQFQFFAFGCCTISPKLNTMLAYKRKIIPDFHYIICKDDYSDLINKVEWCKNNRQKCIEIGRNAQKLFLETSTPKRIWDYIEEVLNAT